MNPHNWFEKAERLRSTIALLRQAGPVADEFHTNPEEGEATERVAIAHWLRQEFSNEPPEDTATLPLFIGTPR